MRTKPTKAESQHMARIKEMPCCVCDEPGPSEAHHVKQSSGFLTVPLCKSCHTGDLNGIHRQKRMWMLMKMDETDALGEVIRRMSEG